MKVTKILMPTKVQHRENQLQIKKLNGEPKNKINNVTNYLHSRVDVNQEVARESLPEEVCYSPLTSTRRRWNQGNGGRMVDWKTTGTSNGRGRGNSCSASVLE